MPTDVSPTARALMVLEAVQNQPGITADRLAGRLGVSERAVRRQVAILREAGLPIDAERGPYGGYRIGRGLGRTPLLFTATEALGLVMAVLDGHHDTFDPSSPVAGALDKLLRVLPAPVAAHAETVRRTVAPAPDRGAARPDQGTTATIVEGCATLRRCRLTYRSEAGNEWEMVVDPWAVVVRHGRWYLLCWSHRAGDTRTYRLDRVQAVELLDDTFSAPEGLDPVATLEAQLAVGWEYACEVRIHAGLGELAGWVPRSLGRLEEIDEHTCLLTGSTSAPRWYAEQLASLPAPFHIVGGAELQAAVRELGERYLAAASITG